MPIDTPQKRRSVLGLYAIQVEQGGLNTVVQRMAALWKTLPLPDGTLSAADRQHILWQYIL